MIRNDSGSYRRPGQELQMKVHDNPQSVYIASAWFVHACCAGLTNYTEACAVGNAMNMLSMHRDTHVTHMSWGK